MTPVVRVNNLWVSYGKVRAVRGISFEIPKGEVFGFIGPNGAGKSSTIKVLATLLRNFYGEAQVTGIDVRRNPLAVREKIGYMPDFFGVYDDLTVREYLHFFAAAYRLDPQKRRGIVGDVLELTDLTGKIDAGVDTLSRGMKQRLALARVLLHDPELLLLDEPASGLDPRARIEIRELLKELRGMGKTILISSHILHELSQLCTRIGIIEAGQLVAEGSLTDIYRQLGLLRMVHVQLNSPTDELIERIGEIGGVESVDRQVDRLSIRLHEDQTSVEDLHDRIHALGARIHMFQPEAMDMETVFMKLTEGRTA
jgi:ABC-2 type transport system ATP-binding protein